MTNTTDLAKYLPPPDPRCARCHDPILPTDFAVDAAFTSARAHAACERNATRRLRRPADYEPCFDGPIRGDSTEGWR